MPGKAVPTVRRDADAGVAHRKMDLCVLKALQEGQSFSTVNINSPVSVNLTALLNRFTKI